jgi:hypothetical protein
MARVKSPAMPPRLVWRISVAAPNGLWVDPSKLEDSVLSQALPEVSSGSWVMSSFDLLHGTDITEDADASTIPADLFDELFEAPKKDPARPRR